MFTALYTVYMWEDYTLLLNPAKSFIWIMPNESLWVCVWSRRYNRITWSWPKYVNLCLKYHLHVINKMAEVGLQCLNFIWLNNLLTRKNPWSIFTTPESPNSSDHIANREHFHWPLSNKYWSCTCNEEKPPTIWPMYILIAGHSGHYIFQGISLRLTSG